MTPSMYVAAFAWLCLVVGYFNRRHRARHITLMLAGIFIDIALVLYLQVTREAIQKALRFDLAILNQLHIACSTAALILYFPILYFGFRLMKGDMSVRGTHQRIGTIALLFRTLGFTFMFSLIGRATVSG